MNLSLQTHCFFSSSDYTAPKHTEQFLGGSLCMCVCVSVCVCETERGVCYLCTARVQVCVSVSETGTDSRSGRASCLRVHASQPLLCFGFLPGKYEIGRLLCPLGLNNESH